MRDTDVRLAACALVRRRFVGRRALEARAQRSELALCELEVRLELANEEDLKRAQARAVSRGHETRSRSYPAARAEERRRAGERWSSTTRLEWMLPEWGWSGVAAPAPAPLAKRLELFRAARRLRCAEAALRVVEPALRAAASACDYRRAAGRWAGGDHTIEVRVGSPDASGETRRVWSKNGKWSGVDSVHTYCVRADWLARVPEAARVISGRLTLDLEPELESRIHPATWAEQARGLAIRSMLGWVVETSSGCWAHARTLVHARRIARTAAVSAAVSAAAGAA